MPWTVSGAPCRIPRCAGTKGSNPFDDLCDRHNADPTAPPMKVTCECAEPLVERLPMFGTSQCGRCGSPLTLPADAFGLLLGATRGH